MNLIVEWWGKIKTFTKNLWWPTHLDSALNTAEELMKEDHEEEIKKKVKKTTKKSKPKKKKGAK